jgi:hypothetical protein
MAARGELRAAQSVDRRLSAILRRMMRAPIGLMALVCWFLSCAVSASAQVELSITVEPAQISYPQHRTVTYRLTMTTGDREERLSVAPGGIPFANGGEVRLEGPGTLGFGIHGDPPPMRPGCSRSRVGTQLLRFYTVALPPASTSVLVSPYMLIAPPWPGSDLRLRYSFDSFSPQPSAPITFLGPKDLSSPRPTLAGLTGVHLTLTTRPNSSLQHPARVRLGHNVLIRGHADPGIAGDRIVLRASRRNQRPVTIATTRVRPDGTFAATWHPTRRGTYGLYAIYHSEREIRSNASTPCDVPLTVQ